MLFVESFYKNATIDGAGDGGWSGAARTDSAGIAAERFGATVNGEASAGVRAHHGAQNGERKLVFSGDVAVELHEIVKNIVAGADLGDSSNLGHIFPGGSAACRDFADFDSLGSQTIGNTYQQLPFFMTRVGDIGRSRENCPSGRW